jgi:Glycosyltransferase like family
MFSILICSLNESYLSRIKTNIQETIGHPYELLVWDNLNEQKSITEVYNLLATRAQYPYWCFIHEDIRFETVNWSENLRVAFEQHPDTGLIGIAGARYKSRTPSGWSTGIRELDFCNIYHEDKKLNRLHIYLNPNRTIFEPVVNVDGVFMVIRREVWKDAQFNETFLRGFHLYDIDFSFHVNKKWKAAVLFNIDILHFTEGGNYGDAWLEPTIRWHEKFGPELPQFISGKTEQSSMEIEIGKFWLRRLSVEKISWKYKWKWISTGKSWRNPSTWYAIGLFLFGKWIRREKPKR